VHHAPHPAPDRAGPTPRRLRNCTAPATRPGRATACPLTLRAGPRWPPPQPPQPRARRPTAAPASVPAIPGSAAARPSPTRTHFDRPARPTTTPAASRTAPSTWPPGPIQTRRPRPDQRGPIATSTLSWPPTKPRPKPDHASRTTRRGAQAERDALPRPSPTRAQGRRDRPATSAALRTAPPPGSWSRDAATPTGGSTRSSAQQLMAPAAAHRTAPCQQRSQPADRGRHATTATCPTLRHQGPDRASARHPGRRPAPAVARHHPAVPHPTPPPTLPRFRADPDRSCPATAEYRARPRRLSLR
jgi:hypothetical protein